MNLEQQSRQATVQERTLPSFSIVYETENLSSVELENIYRSLASLSQQEISPEIANEFLIINAGSAPEEVINEICAKYPWVTVKQVSNVGYQEAKMFGASIATGEVVVFCDSDCEYSPNWMKDVLSLFAKDENINVVAGETSTPIRNPYELAVAIHYFFPRFTNRGKPYVANHYFFNGVAFRRNFLLENPVPINLPLYRNYCFLHIHLLCKVKGYEIWKHPMAKNVHEPPTPSFIFWRYLLMGRDSILRNHLKGVLTENPDKTDFSNYPETKFTAVQRINGIITAILNFKLLKRQQIRAVLKEDPKRRLILPLALFIAIWFELLFLTGKIITYIQPNLVLKLYGGVEGK